MAEESSCYVLKAQNRFGVEIELRAAAPPIDDDDRRRIIRAFDKLLDELWTLRGERVIAMTEEGNG